jgi:UDP-2,3-diacylglucosamine pyrophosphatase LpxH
MMYRRILCGASLLIALLATAGAEIQPLSSPGRTTVVISDLHMGLGRNASGAWQPLEDFRWPQEFAAFLDAVDSAGQSAVDFVLNGDTFELLQATGRCDAGAIGCTESEELARLERVLAAHDGELKALGRFARNGANRIVFVPGDHDAALLFPRVARRVIDALQGPANRALVASSGSWVSADGRLAAEHGHQVAPNPRRLTDWPAPFVRFEGRELLAKSPVEEVLRSLYDRLEEIYPIVDNLAAEGSGVKYALAAGGGIEAQTVEPLLRVFLLTTPWQQFRMELDDGEVEPPVWDVAQVRRQQGSAFFATSLPDDDPFKRFVGSVPAPALAAFLKQWSDDEILAVCDYRAAVRRARRRFEPAVTQFAPRGPALAECPRTPDTRGAQFDYFWQSRDRTFARHLDKLSSAALSGPRIAVFVHGHTHLADRSQTNANMISGGLLKIPMEGFSPVRGSLSPIVINGGAWQRTITPVQYERLRTEKSLTDDQLLRSLKPEDLAPCYSFVEIPPYSDAPSPRVRYWRQADGKWVFAAGCGT